MAAAPPAPAQPAKEPPERGGTTISPFDVTEASFVAAAPEASSLPPPALSEIAFAGRSNVGKSSMMNAMMQRRGLVRTSGTPGCTRGINLFLAETRAGLQLHMVDLPGYGFAKRSKDERKKWGNLVEGYLRERPTLRLVLVLVDVRRGVEEDDVQLLDFVAAPRPGNAPVNCWVVATKLDLLPKSKRKPALLEVERLAGRRVLGFSAEESFGRLDVWRVIDREIRGPAADPELEPTAASLPSPIERAGDGTADD